jgi:hypothetical protein
VEQASDQFERGRFACAVGTEKHEYFAFVQF